MRESVGNVFVINIIIVFVIIFIVLFAGSTSYTKAYKVKNRIIEIIERNRDYNPNAKREIDTFLGNTGYRVITGSRARCTPHYNAGRSIMENNPTSGYRYCVEKFIIGSGPTQKVYYGVTAFMYFELPLITSYLELPVYGETKMIGILGN